MDLILSRHVPRNSPDMTPKIFPQGVWSGSRESLKIYLAEICTLRSAYVMFCNCSEYLFWFCIYVMQYIYNDIISALVTVSFLSVKNCTRLCLLTNVVVQKISTRSMKEET